MEVVQQKFENVKIDKLSEHPKNPKEGDLASIEDSINENGFFGAILVQRSTGYILAGNHRYRKAVELGAKTLPVIYLEVDDQKALKILLADNRTSELGSYNQEALASLLGLLKESGSVKGSGYDEKAIGALMTALKEPDKTQYSKKVESPVYKPRLESPPSLLDLTDKTKYQQLLDSIESANVSPDLKTFLQHAAARHIVFDYEEIAEYYCHAPAEIQRLMEESALVIIDFNQAIEKGFVKLIESFATAFEEEGPDAEDDEE